MQVAEMFFKNPQDCRRHGEIAQGLVKNPVKSDWVINLLEAEREFRGSV